MPSSAAALAEAVAAAPLPPALAVAADVAAAQPAAV